MTRWGMSRWDRIVLKVASRLIGDLTRRRVLLALRMLRYRHVTEQERKDVGWEPDRVP